MLPWPGENMKSKLLLFCFIDIPAIIVIVAFVLVFVR